MKRTIYILTGIVLLSLSSCSDFLEPKSQSEYVPKDANALQEMLIGSAYPRQDKGNFLLPFLSFLDDDIQFHKTDYEFSINSLKDVEAKQAVYIIHGNRICFLLWKGMVILFRISGKDTITIS